VETGQRQVGNKRAAKERKVEDKEIKNTIQNIKIREQQTKRQKEMA
jgi:hypothetical protein